jgi:GNAT superfamily N-acetyltransferase
MRQSKAYWGYGQAQMNSWQQELTVTPKYIGDYDVFKLIEVDKVLGYYAFKRLGKQALKLDSLFVLPEHIGKGLGKMLLMDFFDRIKSLNVASITLDADPHAESFYHYFGFVTVGKLATTIEGRYLPVMKKELLYDA